VSGALVEQFLEAAPVPLGVPVEEVERRLGPAAKVRARDERPIGFQYPDRGVWLAAEEGVVTAVSFLTGTADEGGARFAAPLPGGLTVDDPPEKVLALYGPPDRIQEIALGGSPKGRMILSFYELNAPATVTFATRSDQPGRLDRIVLTRRA
jgi:hypothetical protein